MHIVTGGAYNGKTAWVRDYYQWEKQENGYWFNAYEKEPFPVDLSEACRLVVVEGVEQMVFQWMEDKTLDNAREHGREWIRKWIDWEQASSGRQLIVIGTDISKGIVPMEPSLRKWRDLTGWFYQDVVEKSDRFDIVWYGIGKQLK